MRLPGVIAVPHRILVIDDSPLILELTRRALEGAGYDVATAMTLGAFEAERHRTPPDLIIVDIQMPEIFGDDLALTLRGAYGEKAPIVLLSSLDEEELAERASYAGARGWVTKKAGLEALLAKVAEIFAAPSAT
jgi:DNA-binding response OmpR family regulator